MASETEANQYVICLNNRGYEGCLITRRLYRTLPDEDAQQHGMIRVVDEEQEDYLYPKDWFVPANLSTDVLQAIEEAPTRTDFSKYLSDESGPPELRKAQ